MDVKSWYQSKIVWVNLIAALIMILDLLVQQPFLPPAYLPYIGFVVGILNVIMRVWFTDTGIASQKAQVARAAQK